MDKKIILRDKIIELEKLYTVNMSEQMKTATKDRIQRLFNEDPIKHIHLGDMTNKLSLQENKLVMIKQHIWPKVTEENIKEVKEQLEQEINLLKEIISLYKEITEK